MSAPKDPEKRRQWIERIAAAKKGKPLSEKCKSRLREAMTPEVYKRQADSRRGRALSEEHKRKIAEANRGRQFSEEHLHNLRQTIHSEEYRAKISAARRGKKHQRHKSPSLETIAKRAAALRGRKVSEETKRKISEKNKGQKPSPLAIERSREWHRTHPHHGLGRKMSPEAIEKMASAKRGKKQSPESIEKRRKAMMGHLVSAETRAKLSKANSHPCPPLPAETKRKISQAHKRRWVQLPEEQKRRKIQQMRNPDGQYYKGSKLERLIGEILEDLAIDAHHHYKIGTYEADFFIPQWNLVVECDGRYWHSLPETQARDRVRDAFMHERGYVVLRLLEQDIRANAAKTLIRGLKSAAVTTASKGA